MQWFQLWREHVTRALSLNQRLQVFFFEGRVGKGGTKSLLFAARGTKSLLFAVCCSWYQVFAVCCLLFAARVILRVADTASWCALGKIKPNSPMTAWQACHKDAIRRDALFGLKQQFVKALSIGEKARLQVMSSDCRDDARGEAPGSVRGDEEERLFVAALGKDDRGFYEGHKGLGNSQKAEVAWLELKGYAYEELDVRDFASASSAPRAGLGPS
jgi:hypothetical protein